jgi:hypothetical protein
MDDPKDIDEALLMLQANPPVLTKNKDGQVGNQKTKYADLVQVNAQVLSRLNALGVVWKCCPDLLEPDYRFVLRYELRHVPSGTAEKGVYPLKGENAMQQGSSITYARRYALLAVTGIAAEDEDDDGDQASGRQHAQRAAPRPRPREAPTVDDAAPVVQRSAQRPRGTRPPLPGENPDGPVGTEQHRTMRALWRDIGFDGDENREKRLTVTARILGLPDLDSSAELTRGQGETVIAALRERKAKMAEPGGDS